MAILLITGDLVQISRVESAARGEGVSCSSVMSAAKAIEQIPNLSPQLVIVDMSAPGLDIQKFVAEVRAMQLASQPKILAFASHVHEQKIAAATAAGCDLVLSRGQFDRELRRIVTGQV